MKNLWKVAVILLAILMIAKWGHGGAWAEVKPEHFDLLGIKKPIQSQPGLSTDAPPKHERNRPQHEDDSHK